MANSARRASHSCPLAAQHGEWRDWSVFDRVGPKPAGIIFTPFLIQTARTWKSGELPRRGEVLQPRSCWKRAPPTRRLRPSGNGRVSTSASPSSSAISRSTIRPPFEDGLPPSTALLGAACPRQVTGRRAGRGSFASWWAERARSHPIARLDNERYVIAVASASNPDVHPHGEPSGGPGAGARDLMSNLTEDHAQSGLYLGAARSTGPLQIHPPRRTMLGALSSYQQTGASARQVCSSAKPKSRNKRQFTILLPVL